MEESKLAAVVEGLSGRMQKFASAALYEVLVLRTRLRAPPIFEFERDGSILSVCVRSDEHNIDPLPIEREHVLDDDPTLLRQSSVEGPQQRWKTRAPCWTFFLGRVPIECIGIARFDFTLQPPALQEVQRPAEIPFPRLHLFIPAQARLDRSFLKWANREVRP